MDQDYDLIQRISTTNASFHGRQVDLSERESLFIITEDTRRQNLMDATQPWKGGQEIIQLICGINFVMKESPEKDQKEKDHLLLSKRYLCQER